MRNCAAGTILAASAYRHYAPDFEGRLSLKWMMRGQAHYTTGDGGRFLVRPGAYLLLNHGTRYTLEIDAPADEKVESFCLFWDPVAVAAAFRDRVTPADRLLDDPFAPARGTGNAPQPIRFWETLYADADDPLLTAALRHLHRRTYAPDTLCVAEQDERLRAVVERLLFLHRGIGRRVEMLPAIRPATRRELLRRLMRGRDYIDATLGEPDSDLEAAAGAACLSPHHFLRAFAGAFGETPHRYRTRQRLERAAQLLRATDRPVTTICADVGWESPGSFSALFRRQFGTAPTEWRGRERASQPQN